MRASADETVPSPRRRRRAPRPRSAGSTATTSNEATTPDGFRRRRDPEADETVTKRTGFTVPRPGTSSCYIDRKSVRCDIGDRDWEPPRAPNSCDLDWGQRIELSAGGSAGGSSAPATTTLGAGRCARLRALDRDEAAISKSEESGMTAGTPRLAAAARSEQSYEIVEPARRSPGAANRTGRRPARSRRRPSALLGRRRRRRGGSAGAGRRRQRPSLIGICDGPGSDGASAG